MGNFTKGLPEILLVGPAGLRASECRSLQVAERKPALLSRSLEGPEKRWVCPPRALPGHSSAQKRSSPQQVPTDPLSQVK